MDPKLNVAIEDSYFLLAFCARARIEPTAAQKGDFDDAILKLSRVQTKVAESEPLSAVELADFWDAFIFVSNVCYPATIETIRYYFHFHYRPRIRLRSPRTWTRAFLNPHRSFGVATLVVLAATILASLLWFVGQTALTQYKEHYEQYATIAALSRFDKTNLIPRAEWDDSAKLYRISVGDVRIGMPGIPEGRSAWLFQLYPQMLNKSGASVVGAPEKSSSVGKPASYKGQPSPERDEVDLEPSCREVAPPTQLTRDACSDPNPKVHRRDWLLADQLGETFSNLNTDLRMLRAFIGPFERAYAALAGIGLVPDDPVLAPSRATGDVLVTASTPAGVSGSFGRPTPGPEPRDPRELRLYFAHLLKANNRVVSAVPPPPYETLVATQAKAQLALSILSKYVLTFLFGTLGACVHVVREINARLDNFTLARSAMRRYWARIVLGGIAGPFIGLFFDPSGQLIATSSTVKAEAAILSQMSPLAIAFVAGFSVEILFSVLDRFIKTIRGLADIESNHPIRR